MSSILGADTYNELTQTLQALQSPDNTIRSQAEDYLQNTWVNTRPEYLLLGLAEHISNSSDVSVCAPPSVLLSFRRILAFLSCLLPTAYYQPRSILTQPLLFSTKASVFRRRHFSPDSLQDTQERQGRVCRDLYLLSRRFCFCHQAEAP